MNKEGNKKGEKRATFSHFMTLLLICEVAGTEKQCWCDEDLHRPSEYGPQTPSKKFKFGNDFQIISSSGASTQAAS